MGFTTYTCESNTKTQLQSLCCDSHSHSHGIYEFVIVTVIWHGLGVEDSSTAAAAPQCLWRNHLSSKRCRCCCCCYKAVTRLYIRRKSRRQERCIRRWYLDL